ncbi:hypothetical protein [Streptomyces sp. NPDC001508]|uniref:hypothetical protein n=1 Tax=Streptomyces sp. NPDC001508 TaxID=3154656 RepID=UPI003333B7B5
MEEVPERIDPATDRVTAAILLGCAPHEVGYCPRCLGLTHRYGRNARVLCPACAVMSGGHRPAGDAVRRHD